MAKKRPESTQHATQTYNTFTKLKMATDTLDISKLQDELDSLSAQITKQGAEVRTLKKSNSDAGIIAEAVSALQKLKIDHEALSKTLDAATGGGDTFNRKTFDEMILRKMFVIPSFEIHGGVKGLFDLGPPACALKVRDCFAHDFIVYCLLFVQFSKATFFIGCDD